MTYGRRVQDRNQFKHIGQKNFIEKMRVALFQRAEEDILLKTIRLGAQLD